MRIQLRVVCPADAKAVLRQDPGIVGAVDLSAPVFEVPADGALFDRILALTRDTSGLWLNPVMTFADSDFEQCRFVQPECRGKLLRETDTDHRLNAERLNARPLLSTGADSRVHWLDRLALTRADVKPNAIAGAGDWTTEFIAGPTVFDMFREAGLQGLLGNPVFNSRTKNVHPRCFQLATDHVAPPALRDRTTLPPCAAQGVTSFRALGCLAYHQLPRASSDFYRTAENWASHFQPLWIVSQRVKQCCERFALRGWAFRPVLEGDSGEYSAYLDMWKKLTDKITSNPKNHF